MQTSVRRAADILGGADHILVFTGAGISVESGIPDFRGPAGLWSRVDPSLFEIGRYLTDVHARREVWRIHLTGDLNISDLRPNPAHDAVVDLWESGRMAGCITQNIDGLHQKAGLPETEIAELHGNLRRVRCISCAGVWPADEILHRISEGEDDPRCLDCGGILKSTTVLFGELLPGAAIARAQQMSDEADAVLSIGSTLSVYPAVDFVLEAVSRGAPLVIANLGPTDRDDLATVRVDGPAGSTIPAIVEKLLGASRQGP
ncbi:NAD-dependent protein deacetylase [bacterium BMS3Abin02]|nr:NAD-dependent protein deacetylase [bacterium BMS3Abin02]GBE21129.1 NAD-dependent protein deacetylase [bacterium BMS3Bbin01]HDH25563.1 NAD-dependent deacetylase [Actinomycetota bacterium]